MIEVIKGLVQKGHAYVIDGDVYFRVTSFKEYGKLSKRNIEDLKAGARVEVDERKTDPLDFALWKASKPGEPAWESPWGPGRPGLAHRMFRHGFQASGRDLRHPCRRQGPYLSASRERDRPERGVLGQEVRELLDPQRVREHQLRRRCPSRLGTSSRSAISWTSTMPRSCGSSCFRRTTAARSIFPMRT